MDVNQNHATISNQYIFDGSDEKSVEKLFEEGLRALTEKLYKTAYKRFSEAVSRGLNGATVQYYLALSNLQGYKPSRHRDRTEEVYLISEQHIRRAIEIDPSCTHAYALWAAIKKDYYRNQPHEPPPSADELRHRSQPLDPIHAAEIAPFLNDPNEPIWRQALDAARASVRQRNPGARKYFIPVPDPPNYLPTYAVIFMGALLVVGGIFIALNVDGVVGDLLGVLPIIGGVSAGLGGAARRWKLKQVYERRLRRSFPKPSDEEMDRWLSLDRFFILNDALSDLGRSLGDLISEPYMVIGPADGTKFATGADGLTRFSRYSVIILLLTRRRISVYSCQWDFETCKITGRETFDCRYTDITGLSTKETRGNSALTLLRPDGKAQKANFTRVFEMVIAGTDRIAVVIAAAIPDSGHNRLPPTGASAAERLIRWQLNLHH